MADYEGYLLLHDRGCTADPLYFELEGGLLQYYSKKNGKWLGQFSMTRHRVTARPVKNPSSPNRFVVDFCPVRSIHDTERSMHQFKRMSIVLSASTERVMQEWIRAIYMWRRRNWRESVVIADHDDEFSVLRMMMHMYHLELKITRDLDLKIRKIEMTPELNESERAMPELAKRMGSILITPRTRAALSRFGRWGYCSTGNTASKTTAIL
ncbi:hypothetical protein P43SY_001195 [Pythium insidiosum]|uniref:PH domain-containing protein n=1 Tax=Pythium insidiosum TaxID=114742 RepID=A0AAD5Q8G4_PYTIN|nr:hypothetical protein P43SY_001195 [Pythium insidiosum]